MLGLVLIFIGVFMTSFGLILRHDTLRPERDDF